MRGTIAKILVVACAATVVGGCASHRRDTGESSAPAAATAPAPAPNPAPPGSRLAKVQVGMGMNEVSDLIGPPTDTHSYITGKAFIPYYFGDDTARVEWHYKGLGRVVFSAGGGWGRQMGVARVEYDPNESGYYRAQ